MDRDRAFFDTHGAALESTLSAAVNEAMDAQAEDPILFIAEKLLAVSGCSSSESLAQVAWRPIQRLLLKQSAAGIGRIVAGENKMSGDEETIRYFQFGSTDEFLHGLAGLTNDGLTRSMKDEFRFNDGGQWWEEYQYVVERKAEEDVDLPSTAVHKGSVSLNGALKIRDRGHAGMRLKDFCALSQAREAKLSEAEVAALRLYTGPLFAPLNKALRERQVDQWATTIACCYSAVLKLSFLSRPTRVYRGVKEDRLQLPRKFFCSEEGHFAGGVERAFSSTTRDLAVALDYAGASATDAKCSIFAIDFDMTSRGASVKFVSQYPHEDELIFPPCTGFTTRDFVEFGSKRCVVLSVQVSTARPDTREIKTPEHSPAQRVRRLFYVVGNAPNPLIDRLVTAPLLSAGMDYHLFLSHCWEGPSSRDVMRIVKLRLAEMMPGARVFLDADDMHAVEDWIERYFVHASAVLIFISKGYFSSPNAMRELRKAVELGKPLIAVAECEPHLGALTRAQVHEQLVEAGTLFNRWALKGGGGHGPTGKEYVRWHREGGPSVAALEDALFKEPVIIWDRSSVYQDTALRLICERMEGLDARPVYLQGELAYHRHRVPPPRAPRTYHLCTSSSNPGVLDVVEELNEHLEIELCVTQDLAKASQSEHFLFVMNNETWGQKGSITAQLTHDIADAMRVGLHIICVQELDTDRGGSYGSRDDLIGRTPRVLKGSGLFRERILELQSGATRIVSLVLLAEPLVAPPPPLCPNAIPEIESLFRSQPTSRITVDILD